MSFLHALQRIRFPLGEKLAQCITYLGEETFFIIIGMVILWCFSRKQGYRFLYIGINGTFINQLLKAIFLIPRPWIKDPEFTIVESAREGASGYSFPSGHTQSSTMTFTFVAALIKKTWVRVLCIIMMLLVGFSRMYLGVHTPLDVSIGLIAGVAIVYGMLWLYKKTDKSKNGMYLIQGITLLMSVITLLYVTFAPRGDRNILQFDEEGIEACCKLFGATLGLIICQNLTEHHFTYNCTAVWWVQIIKVVLGLLLLLGVKEGLKAALSPLPISNTLTNILCYCMVSLFGGFVWPMTFRWFANIGSSK